MVVTSVVIHNGKAYVPTTIQIEAGPYLSAEPIFTINITIKELTQALEMAVKTGNPQTPTPHEKYQQRRDPILKAAGLKSWASLTRNGASYGIELHDDQTVIYCPAIDDKGQFINDPTKSRKLMVNSDIQNVATTIVTDWNTHKI